MNTAQLSREALDDFGIALQSDDLPATWTSRLRTGLVTLAVEHANDPTAGLDLLFRLYPDGPASAGLTEQDLWARLLLRQGDIAGALSLARDRQAERDSTIPRLLMLEALLAAGNPAAAQELAAAMDEVAAAGSVAPALARGLVALAAGDLDEAEAAFAEALAKRPDNVPALRGRADCAVARGDLEEAAGILRDAAAIAGAEARPALLRRLATLQSQMDAVNGGEPEIRDAGMDSGGADILPALDPATNGLHRHGTGKPEDGISQVRPSPGAAQTAEDLHQALATLAARLREELETARAARGRRSRERTAIDQTKPQVRASGLLERSSAGLDDLAPEDLTRALFEHFGHASFRPGQAAVLRCLLTEGRDTLALMPTGAGKSLCFQLPALLLPGVVLVISPLVALMADQIAGLAEVQALAGRATYINSTLAADELQRRLASLAAGAYALVYVAPERLRHAEMQHALRRAGISLLVIDEAHCLCLWGHDFRTEYLAVGNLVRTLAVPRLLAVTATATLAMQEEIAQTLGRPLRVVSTGVLRDNLYLEVRELADKAQKRAALVEFVRAARGSGIVYATSRDDCERLANDLRRAGVNARHYHAGLATPERQQTQEQFMAGRTRVLAATVAFGMGVNKRDVRFIVHFNPARSLEAYAQEAGRAGRDGQPAHCLLLATTADRATLTRHAHEGHLSKDALRALYVRVRAALRNSSGGPIDMASLTPADEDPQTADTVARVGLSALERAGYLERGLDVPRHFTLLLHQGADDPKLVDLARAWRLPYDDERIVASGSLAVALGVELPEVETLLADWQDRGLLDYRPERRGLTLRLVEPPPADGAQRLDALLTTYAAAQDARSKAMAGYFLSNRCRNAYIAHHFGEPQARNCGRCDVCRPEGRRTVAPKRTTRAAGVTTMAPREATLRLPDELPFKVGRSGLIKILRGAGGSAIGPDRCALHGVLGGMREVEVQQHLEALLEEGLLALVDAGEFKAVALTEKGRQVLAEDRASTADLTD